MLKELSDEDEQDETAKPKFETDPAANRKLLQAIMEKEQEELDAVEAVLHNPEITETEETTAQTVADAVNKAAANNEQIGPFGPPMPEVGMSDADMDTLKGIYSKLIGLVPHTVPKTAIKNAKIAVQEFIDHDTFELEKLDAQHKALVLAHSMHSKNLSAWRKTLSTEQITSTKNPEKTYTKIIYEYDEHNKIVYPESVEKDGKMHYPLENMTKARMYKKQIVHLGMFIGVMTKMLDVSWVKDMSKLHKSAKGLRMQVVKAEPLHDIGNQTKRHAKVKDMAYGKHFLPVVAMQMARKNLVGGQVSASIKQPRSRSVGRPSRAARPTNTTTDARPGWMNNLGM